MPSFKFPSRLYAILDVDLLASTYRQPLDVLDAWLSAGMKLVQLRAKSAPDGTFLRCADDVVSRCRGAGALSIVNDRADIARIAGADGVHLGQDDMPPAAVRQILGSDSVIGLSTHSPEQAAAACAAPIDYLAIGPVFATSSKRSPNPVVGLDGVARAAALAHAAALPIVAIGGITLPTASSVIAAGADAVAVISDLVAGDVPGRARDYLLTL
jgi:thiamine-phosphate pyrophosphorylase